VSPPVVTELSNGRYYFDWTWSTSADPDIVFQVDGGPSIPTEEVRYISGGLSSRDNFLDEPISQVKDDVWTDTVDRATGTKGDFVEHIGIQSDAVDASTVFGKLYKARDSVMGGTGLGGTGVDIKTVSDSVGTAQTDLTDIKGVGFATGTDSLAAASVRLARVLGMIHENSVLDQTTYNSDNKILTGRMRIYGPSTGPSRTGKQNADAALAASPGVYDTGKLAEYAILASYVGSNIATYKLSWEA